MSVIVTLSGVCMSNMPEILPKECCTLWDPESDIDRYFGWLEHHYENSLLVFSF